MEQPDAPTPYPTAQAATEAWQAIIDAFDTLDTANESWKYFLPKRLSLFDVRRRIEQIREHGIPATVDVLADIGSYFSQTADYVDSLRSDIDFGGRNNQEFAKLLQSPAAKLHNLLMTARERTNATLAHHRPVPLWHATPPPDTTAVPEARPAGTALRPARPLQPDGTPIIVLSDSDSATQQTATAVGAVPAPDGTGEWQVVRLDDGHHHVRHPALIHLKSTGPYPGVDEADRYRWAAFDRAEALGEPYATFDTVFSLREGDSLLVDRNGKSKPCIVEAINRTEQRGKTIYTVTTRGTRGGKKTAKHDPYDTFKIALPEQHPMLPSNPSNPSNQPSQDSKLKTGSTGMNPPDAPENAAVDIATPSPLPPAGSVTTTTVPHEAPQPSLTMPDDIGGDAMRLRRTVEAIKDKLPRFDPDGLERIKALILQIIQGDHAYSDHEQRQEYVQACWDDLQQVKDQADAWVEVLEAGGGDSATQWATRAARGLSAQTELLLEQMSAFPEVGAQSYRSWADLNKDRLSVTMTPIEFHTGDDGRPAVFEAFRGQYPLSGTILLTILEHLRGDLHGSSLDSPEALQIVTRSLVATTAEVVEFAKDHEQFAGEAPTARALHTAAQKLHERVAATAAVESRWHKLHVADPGKYRDTYALNGEEANRVKAGVATRAASDFALDPLRWWTVPGRGPVNGADLAGELRGLVAAGAFIQVDGDHSISIDHVKHSLVLHPAGAIEALTAARKPGMPQAPAPGQPRFRDETALRDHHASTSPEIVPAHRRAGGGGEATLSTIGRIALVHAIDGWHLAYPGSLLPIPGATPYPTPQDAHTAATALERIAGTDKNPFPWDAPLAPYLHAWWIAEEGDHLETAVHRALAASPATDPDGVHGSWITQHDHTRTAEQDVQNKDIADGYISQVPSHSYQRADDISFRQLLTPETAERIGAPDLAGIRVTVRADAGGRSPDFDWYPDGDTYRVGRTADLRDATWHSDDGRSGPMPDPVMPIEMIRHRPLPVYGARHAIQDLERAQFSLTYGVPDTVDAGKTADEPHFHHNYQQILNTLAALNDNRPPCGDVAQEFARLHERIQALPATIPPGPEFDRLRQDVEKFRSTADTKFNSLRRDAPAPAATPSRGSGSHGGELAFPWEADDTKTIHVNGLTPGGDQEPIAVRGRWLKAVPTVLGSGAAERSGFTVTVSAAGGQKQVWLPDGAVIERLPATIPAEAVWGDTPRVTVTRTRTTIATALSEAGVRVDTVHNENNRTIRYLFNGVEMSLAQAGAHYLETDIPVPGAPGYMLAPYSLQPPDTPWAGEVWQLLSPGGQPVTDISYSPFSKTWKSTTSDTPAATSRDEAATAAADWHRTRPPADPPDTSEPDPEPTPVAITPTAEKNARKSTDSSSTPIPATVEPVDSPDTAGDDELSATEPAPELPRWDGPPPADESPASTRALAGLPGYSYTDNGATVAVFAGGRLIGRATRFELRRKPGEYRYRCSLGDDKINQKKTAIAAAEHIAEVHHVLAGPPPPVPTVEPVWIEHHGKTIRIHGSTRDDLILRFAMEVVGDITPFYEPGVRPKNFLYWQVSERLATSERTARLDRLAALLNSRGRRIPVRDENGTTLPSTDHRPTTTALPTTTSARLVQDGTARTPMAQALIVAGHDVDIQHNPGGSQITTYIVDGFPMSLAQAGARHLNLGVPVEGTPDYLLAPFEPDSDAFPGRDGQVWQLLAPDRTAVTNIVYSPYRQQWKADDGPIAFHDSKETAAHAAAEYHQRHTAEPSPNDGEANTAAMPDGASPVVGNPGFWMQEEPPKHDWDFTRLTVGQGDLVVASGAKNRAEKGWYTTVGGHHLTGPTSQVAAERAVRHWKLLHEPQTSARERDADLWIEHTRTHTRLHGLQPSDDQAKAAMRVAGFVKSSQTGHFEPRAKNGDGPTAAVSSLVTSLNAIGRVVEIHTSQLQRAQSMSGPEPEHLALADLDAMREHRLSAIVDRWSLADFRPGDEVFLHGNGFWHRAESIDATNLHFSDGSKNTPDAVYAIRRDGRITRPSDPPATTYARPLDIDPGNRTDDEITTELASLNLPLARPDDHDTVAARRTLLERTLTERTARYTRAETRRRTVAFDPTTLPAPDSGDMDPVRDEGGRLIGAIITKQRGKNAEYAPATPDGIQLRFVQDPQTARRLAFASLTKLQSAAPEGWRVCFFADLTPGDTVRPTGLLRRPGTTRVEPTAHLAGHPFIFERLDRADTGHLTLHGTRDGQPVEHTVHPDHVIYRVLRPAIGSWAPTLEEETLAALSDRLTAAANHMASGGVTMTGADFAGRTRGMQQLQALANAAVERPRDRTALRDAVIALTARAQEFTATVAATQDAQLRDKLTAFTQSLTTIGTELAEQPPALESEFGWAPAPGTQPPASERPAVTADEAPDDTAPPKSTSAEAFKTDGRPTVKNPTSASDADNRPGGAPEPTTSAPATDGIATPGYRHSDQSGDASSLIRDLALATEHLTDRVLPRPPASMLRTYRHAWSESSPAVSQLDATTAVAAWYRRHSDDNALAARTADEFDVVRRLLARHTERAAVPLAGGPLFRDLPASTEPFADAPEILQAFDDIARLFHELRAATATVPGDILSTPYLLDVDQAFCLLSQHDAYAPRALSRLHALHEAAARLVAAGPDDLMSSAAALSTAARRVGERFSATLKSGNRRHATEGMNDLLEDVGRLRASAAADDTTQPYPDDQALSTADFALRRVLPPTAALAALPADHPLRWNLAIATSGDFEQPPTVRDGIYVPLWRHPYYRAMLRLANTAAQASSLLPEDHHTPDSPLEQISRHATAVHRTARPTSANPTSQEKATAGDATPPEQTAAKAAGTSTETPSGAPASIVSEADGHPADAADSFLRANYTVSTSDAHDKPSGPPPSASPIPAAVDSTGVGTPGYWSGQADDASRLVQGLALATARLTDRVLPRPPASLLRNYHHVWAEHSRAESALDATAAVAAWYRRHSDGNTLAARTADEFDIVHRLAARHAERAAVPTEPVRSTFDDGLATTEPFPDAPSLLQAHRDIARLFHELRAAASAVPDVGSEPYLLDVDQAFYSLSRHDVTLGREMSRLRAVYEAAARIASTRPNLTTPAEGLAAAARHIGQRLSAALKDGNAYAPGLLLEAANSLRIAAADDTTKPYTDRQALTTAALAALPADHPTRWHLVATSGNPDHQALLALADAAAQAGLLHLKDHHTPDNTAVSDPARTHADPAAGDSKLTDEKPQTDTTGRPASTTPPSAALAAALDGTPVTDLSDNALAEQADLQDDVLTLVRPSHDPLDLAVRRLAERRAWEIDNESKRREPPRTYDNRGEEISDRLVGYGRAADDGARAAATADDLPPAKPGGPSDERWIAIQAEAAQGETYPPTEEQSLIHEAVARRRLNLAVMALAGTGKSTTLKQLARRMPDLSILYLAFNTSVSDKAKEEKANGEYTDNVSPMTANSLARSAIQSRFEMAGLSLNDRLSSDGAHGAKRQRSQDIADILRVYDTITYGPNRDTLTPAHAASLTQHMIRRWCQSSDPEIEPHHLVLPSGRPESAREPMFAALKPIAHAMWADIVNPHGELTYDHDYYVKQWALGGFKITADVIFWDEAQDVNPVFDGVIRAAMDQGIQVVAVGDSNQSIYSFRGATDALAKLPVDAQLTLTQSFRFGSKVADAGNRFLRLLGTPMRLKGLETKRSVLTELGPGQADAILCRTNATAVTEAIDAIERGQHVAVAGGLDELRSFIAAAALLRDGQRTDHKDLAVFDSWEEVRRYVEEEEHAAGSMATLVRLIDDDDDGKLADLIAHRGLVEDIKIADDGQRIWIAGTKPGDADHKEFTDWLKERENNGFGKGEYDPNSKRWFYEPGRHRRTNEHTGRSWWVNNKRDNRLEALAAIRAYIDEHSDAPDPGRGGVVSEHQDPDVTISTAHKSKGLEWKRVRIADDFTQPEYDPSGHIMLETIPNDEVLRLSYVALTRATEQLDAGSLGWVFKATHDDDPTVPPDTNYTRAWKPADLHVGDTVTYWEESGEKLNTGRIESIDHIVLTVQRDTGRTEEIVCSQIERCNGQGEPRLKIAAEQDLRDAVAAGQYTLPLEQQQATPPVARPTGDEPSAGSTATQENPAQENPAQENPGQENPATMEDYARGLSDDELHNTFHAARVEVANQERFERIRVLIAERQRRVLERIADAPAPDAMQDQDIIAEHTWLAAPFASEAFGRASGGRNIVQKRVDALTDEQTTRRTKALLAHAPAPEDLDDQALEIAVTDAYNEFAKMSAHHPMRAEVRDRQAALLNEKITRRARVFQQRPPVAELVDDDLISEIRELEEKYEDTDDRIKDTNNKPILEARAGRLTAVTDELDRRDGAPYAAVLARAEHTGSGSVHMDGREFYTYGSVNKQHDGQYTAQINSRYGARDLGVFRSRIAAVGALAQTYDTNPGTEPERNWGVWWDVDVPVLAREPIAEWLAAPREPNFRAGTSLRPAQPCETVVPEKHMESRSHQGPQGIHLRDRGGALCRTGPHHGTGR